MVGKASPKPQEREIDDWEAFGGDDLPILQELWALARTSALDVDGVVDGIMEELEGDVPLADAEA